MCYHPEGGGEPGDLLLLQLISILQRSLLLKKMATLNSMALCHVQVPSSTNPSSPGSLPESSGICQIRFGNPRIRITPINSYIRSICCYSITQKTSENVIITSVIQLSPRKLRRSSVLFYLPSRLTTTSRPFLNRRGSTNNVFPRLDKPGFPAVNKFENKEVRAHSKESLKKLYVFCPGKEQQ